ncbi:hypothetical protein GCM10009802_30010 [Streptomyces synnematoformans]|uniref:Secreted protein n=1 Tax=Streptomyces synnematoformans TaxID=415721 RepID=A0ABN2YBW5_9ACTN
MRIGTSAIVCLCRSTTSSGTSPAPAGDAEVRGSSEASSDRTSTQAASSTAARPAAAIRTVCRDRPRRTRDVAYRMLTPVVVELSWWKRTRPRSGRTVPHAHASAGTP